MKEDSCYYSPEGPQPDRIFYCALLLSFALFANQMSSRLRSVDWLKTQRVTAIPCLGSLSYQKDPALAHFILRSRICKSFGKVLVVRLEGLSCLGY